MTEEEKVKLGKVYNPYEFPVRIVNDLGKEQWIMQGDRAKIKLIGGKGYDQSPLTLPTYDVKKKKQQKRIESLGNIDLNRTTVPNLRKLAWALGLDISDSLNKNALVDVIDGKVNEWKIPSEGSKARKGFDTLKR